MLVYSLTAFVLFIWTAAMPAKRAIEQRAQMKFEDRMRAIEIKYTRLAYPVTESMSVRELEEIYGLRRAYREIKLRR